VLNLAINARDAMSAGGTLTIQTRNVSHADIGRGYRDYVVIAVSDTGTGMSSSVIEKAFDPFFTTKAIGQGTGLGLSMVDGFARQTGGRAIIDSMPGHGTTVSLWLPRHVGENATAHAQVDGATVRGRGQHVLLVEDEEMLRSIARDVLEEAGYRVSDCAEGYEALRLIDAGPPPDLLVTDIGLPGMDGRQLASAVRETLRAIPVLFVTGYAWDAFADSPALPERTAMLSKPFSVHALIDAVADLLGGTDT
jgi:CheY-like chemotaxis protein